MLGVVTHPSPPDEGGPNGWIVGRPADRGHGLAPPPVGAGADDRGRPAPGYREDHKQPAGTAPGDRAGREGPEGGTGSHIRVLLGRGHPGRGGRGGAPGASAGGEGAHLTAG